MDVDELSTYELPFQKPVSYFHKIVNGGIAGVVGVTCVFPLDLIKTRLQNLSVTPAYPGITHCARSIWTAAPPNFLSKIRAFYAGSSVNLLLVTPEKAIKLVANDIFRHAFAPSKGDYRNLKLWQGMLAGGCAGFCQVVITTPMELLKIQLQMGDRRKSALCLVRDLLKRRGTLGLYQGVGPTLARDVTFSVIYFPFFAEMNWHGPKSKTRHCESVFWWSFISGVVAGASASLLVTPIDVVKTRCQTYPDIAKRGLFEVFQHIQRVEGMQGLFRGASCRAMVVAPLFGVAQVVYYLGVAEKLFP